MNVLDPLVYTELLDPVDNRLHDRGVDEIGGTDLNRGGADDQGGDDRTPQTGASPSHAIRRPKKEADPKVRLALWLQAMGWARRPTPLPGG